MSIEDLTMDERRKCLTHAIVRALADAIKAQEPVEEIRDMVVDCHSYRHTLESYVDPESGLNLVQLAVVNHHVDVVRLLCSKKNRFNFIRVYQVNPPLHLACAVGARKVVQYFVEEQDADLTQEGIVSYRGQVVHQEKHNAASGKAKVDSSSQSQQESKLNEESGLQFDASGNVMDNASCMAFGTGSKNATTAEHFIAKTPYQIAVTEGHLGCANYLLNIIVKRMERPMHAVHESTLLHQACYIGCAEHVKLLLDSGASPMINKRDKAGHMPLHVASLSVEPKCIEILLENGALVDSRADHRTCLHIMYWSKFRPENFVKATNVLLEYGISVDSMDHNNNTALDYLAWELGQKWVQVCKSLISSHHIMELYNYVYSAGCHHVMLSDDQYHQEVFKCMATLLAGGASTIITGHYNKVDHTIVHTLLQNTGWPLNSYLRLHPMHVYQALELFFHYGADPNVIARNNNQSAFTMLLMHSLHEIPAHLKLHFVTLFVQNAADLEILIPEPKQYLENYSDRRWNIYPVMVAIQERHPVAISRLLYAYMAMPHVYASIQLVAEKFLWHRMAWSPSTAGTGQSNTYKKQWLAVKAEVLQVRTLRHCTKLAIFCSLGRQARLAQDLPLPPALISYIQSPTC